MERFFTQIWSTLIALAVFYGVSRLYLWAKRKHDLKTFPEYDRPLSPEAQSFIQEAASILISEREISRMSAPKRYVVFLHTTTLLTTFLCWGLSLLFYGALFLALGVRFEDIGTSFRNGTFGIGVGLFAAIFLAGWMSYVVAQRTEALAKFVALNSDMYGFNLESIHARHLDLIEHKIRAKIISLPQNFNAAAFLRGRNESYRYICGRCFIGLTIISLSGSAVLRLIDIL